jgi:hypothetical protein
MTKTIRLLADHSKKRHLLGIVINSQSDEMFENVQGGGNWNNRTSDYITNEITHLLDGCRRYL